MRDIEKYLLESETSLSPVRENPRGAVEISFPGANSFGICHNVNPVAWMRATSFMVTEACVPTKTRSDEASRKKPNNLWMPSNDQLRFHSKINIKIKSSTSEEDQLARWGPAPDENEKREKLPAKWNVNQQFQRLKHHLKSLDWMKCRDNLMCPEHN